MAEIFDPDHKPSVLICDDNDDHNHHQRDENQRSEPLIQLLPEPLSLEGFDSMVERERDYLPKEDYLSRLRCGDLDLCARREAFDWISKAHSYYRFGPLSLCLAVNYLDRFISICELPRDKAWAVQLLAVACFSIAAKIEETIVPHSIDLQVGDPKFMFEGKTIQRMELLVLDTLNWKMNAITPFCFMGYYFLNNNFTTKGVNRSMQLILCTLRGIDYLEFKPSEIAAAVAIFVSAEFQAVVDIDNHIHLDKDRVLKCIEMMKNDDKSRTRTGESPVGVLDASCFTLKTDEIPTTTTTAESFPSIIETKRRRLS